MQIESIIPPGLCQCGCGRRTKISQSANRRYGHIKGQPRRFLSGHWARVRPLSPLGERFWAKVEKTETCWVWTGARIPKGYGVIHTYGPKVDFAHRVSYQIHVGPIPEGMLICHHCDNPACVRPDHLFVGAPSDNTKDMMVKGRARPFGKRGRVT